MRLWTLHPRHLDRAGLLALWRESLLAQAVLRGETRGYRHHPQLVRFRGQPEPLRAIGFYLSVILEESRLRGYRFDGEKIGRGRECPAERVPVRRGQLLYERDHLLEKLRIRDPAAWRTLIGQADPAPHPLFRIGDGDGVEPWEKKQAGRSP